MNGVGLTAQELVTAYRAHRLSPVEVVDATLAAIPRVDALVGAFTAVCAERARAEARDAEARYASGGDVPPLLGVPFAAKDVFDTVDVVTSYGSPMFASHVPQMDAEAVRRARAAGAILVGKTQTHEFAWGLTSINEAMGSTRNPWSLDRIAGGSSGGSAVAVATGVVPLALGTDTAGSVRLPAALCGVVGLKPTYGRVSLAGVFPLARTLDHVGQLARTPADAAMLLAATARRAPLAFHDVPARSVRGLRFGVAPAACDRDAAVLDRVMEALAPLGAVFVPAPALGETARAILSRVQAAEALQAHDGLYPERVTEYGDDVGLRLRGATGLGLADYLDAQRERTRLGLEMAELLTRVDVLLAVAAPEAPPRNEIASRDAAFRQDVLRRTSLASLCGLPACVVRAELDAHDLPVGVQITGGWGDEATILAIAERLMAQTAAAQARTPTVSVADASAVDETLVHPCTVHGPTT